VRPTGVSGTRRSASTWRRTATTSRRCGAARGWLREPVESELAATAGPLAGKRVIHLQCHFGADSLILAQRGAEVTGVDFSPRAIAAARGLAAELGLEGRASFVECDLLSDCRAAVKRTLKHPQDVMVKDLVVVPSRFRAR
jgi:tRNA/tmRNA/rRNA uracil-C5-methylase (TrmA/RlmC/RlmD family)